MNILHFKLDCQLCFYHWKLKGYQLTHRSWIPLPKACKMKFQLGMTAIYLHSLD